MQFEVNRITKQLFNDFLELTKEVYPNPIDMKLDTDGGNLQVAKDWGDVIKQYRQNGGEINAIAQKVRSAGIVLLLNANIVLTPESYIQFHSPFPKSNTERGKKKRDYLTNYFISMCSQKMNLDYQTIKSYIRNKHCLVGEELNQVLRQ